MKETQALSPSEIVKRNALEILDLRGMKQSDLARAMGWSRAQTTKILRGDRDLRLEEVVELAWHLSVAPSMLLIPWDASVRLRIRFGEKGWYELDSGEAFRWFVAAQPPPMSGIDWGDYFSLVPAVAQHYVKAQLDAYGLTDRIDVDFEKKAVTYRDGDGNVVLSEEWI